MMLRAAAFGDVRAMRALLGDNRSLEVRSANGSTPLHVCAPACGRPGGGPAADQCAPSTLALLPQIAAARGMLSTVQFLVAAGADVNSRELADVGGSTPLHHATRGGFLSVRTASARAARGGGSRPVCVLASPQPRTRQQVVKALLEAGADPNALDAFGRSALHAAAIEGAAPVAKLLIARGADLFLRDGAGFNVTFLAQEYGHAAILQLPGLPAPSSASIEERYVAHCMRTKRARELAELAKAAKGKTKTKGKGKGKKKKK